eukprot:TRINITY_DN9201_c0_g1_i1.p2 TRINITY_DN9201_c0_g1~~TRINITY_DN9201_c0_g1_i1.p2  ORF type:complete len:111 (-),score=24.83 TRINITY_DN9201_c0_g1_i1:524-856(-)
MDQSLWRLQILHQDLHEEGLSEQCMEAEDCPLEKSNAFFISESVRQRLQNSWVAYFQSSNDELQLIAEMKLKLKQLVERQKRKAGLIEAAKLSSSQCGKIFFSRSSLYRK